MEPLLRRRDLVPVGRHAIAAASLVGLALCTHASAEARAAPEPCITRPSTPSPPLSCSFASHAAAGGQPPTLTVSPEPPTQWLRDGVYPLSITASDDQGVGAVYAFLDGRQLTYAGPFCVPPLGPPPVCPSTPPPLIWVLRPAELSDGVHDLDVRAVNSANQVGVRHFPVAVDRTSPLSPTGLALIGGDKWRSDNRFEVTWVNPREVGPTPIVGADYRLCPIANSSHDTTGCVTGQRSGVDIDRIDDLAVPASGTWRLRLAVRDQAGNVDLEGSATLPNLRLDAVPPALSFVGREPNDPARVWLSGQDEESGLARVEVEVRRRGEAIWRSLQTVYGGGSRYSVLLDDDELPAGAYDLRAHAVDNVGNERTTTTLQNGTALEIRLPVREGSALAVGRQQRVRTEKGPVRATGVHVGFGKQVALEGRLTNALGTPRSGAIVEVRERVNLPHAEWREVATLRTSSEGLFKFRATSGPARTVRFDYPGTSTTRSAAAEVALRVSAGVTLRPSRHRLRNGQAVILSGRLLDASLPPEGKIVALQAHTTRGWRTFATARARGEHGQWSYRYRFTGTTSTARYAFRVVVPMESSYPYAEGRSQVARVLVFGGR
jgi:hypothetical protein